MRLGEIRCGLVLAAEATAGYREEGGMWMDGMGWNGIVRVDRDQSRARSEFSPFFCRPARMGQMGQMGRLVG